MSDREPPGTWPMPPRRDEPRPEPDVDPDLWAEEPEWFGP